MIHVHCEKKGHTLYDLIGNSLEIFNNDFDINIVGIDGNLSGPFYQNNIKKFANKPFFLYIEEPQYINTPELISSPNFRGFISHIKNTCEQLYIKYNYKTYYLPLYMDKKDTDRIHGLISTLKSRSRVNLLAWGSWNDITDNNFYNRGGHFIDSLVSNLLIKNCKVNLTFKTNKNLRCKSSFPDNVNIITKYLNKEQMEEIFYNSDIFLLPSKQVHSISLLYSMSFGLPCVVSNGWGMSEYCSDLNSIHYKDTDKIINIISDIDKLIHLRKQVLFDLNNRYNKKDYYDRFRNILEDSI